MKRFVMAMTLTFVITASSIIRADEQDIKIDQLPKAVIDGIKAKYASAKLVSAEKETQGDKVFYEVNIKHNDRAIELLLTPDGKIVSVEQPIAATDLPQAVTQVIQKQYPKATVKSAEETVKEGKATYAVLLENDVMIGKEMQKVQMQLTAAGELIATQKLIAASNLPKAVTEALAKKYPDTTIKRVNETNRDGKVSYIVSLESAERTYLAVLDREGKILKDISRDKKK